MKINGQLVFDASSASEIQNLRVQKYAGTSVPSYTSADAGRMIFATDTSGGYVANTLYYGSAGVSNWVAIATGGNAAALQTEVDAIETSLGSIVNAAGVWQVGTITGPAMTGNEATLQAVLQALSNYANANNELRELDDVNVVGVTNNQYLKYDTTSGKWIADTLTASDLTDVTSSAAELNKLTGFTGDVGDLNVLSGVTGTTPVDISSIAGYAAGNVSATEFSYLDGATSNIQAQLNLVQTADPTLTGLAALAGTGIVVQTVDGLTTTFTHRTLVAPGAGITIAFPDGVSGDPTFALANDLAALEGLTTSGYVVRTGNGTATTRTMSTVPADLVITGDASGVTTDTTFGLAAVTQANSGDFVKLTLDSKGRVVGNTAVVVGDITTLVDSVYVNVAGDTMTANLNMGTNYVTMTNAPVSDTQAANKAYVDSVAAGLSWKNAVRAASTGNLTLASTTVVDGVTLASGDRVLVKNQTAAAENGVYSFNGTGLVRATDMDTALEFSGATVFVTEGATHADSGWTQTAEVVTVGTTAVAFAQFSGSSTYTWGDGLGNTGNTIYVNMGAGIAALPSDEVGIDIVAGKAVQLTGILTGDKLTFVLDGAGLEQSASGLKISALGVTNAMLQHSQLTINGDTGTDALVLGDTLQIKGTATQGVSTVVTESPVGTSTFTITNADASASQKGVAKFDATEFNITAGSVVLGTIPLGKLANATITFAGDTGSDTVSLGETFTFKDGGTHTVSGRLVDATIGTNDVTLKIRQATATLAGVASFDAGQFTINGGTGLVSLTASLDDLTNVSGADSATAADLLTKGAGTDWIPVSRTALAGTIKLGDLQDVATADATADGQVLVADGTNFGTQKIYHLETVAVAATSWVVAHALGQKYCNVTIVDAGDEMVIPQSVKFDSTTQLTVTFNTAVAGKCVVMGIA